VGVADFGFEVDHLQLLLFLFCQERLNAIVSEP
jgi:hypothetical protein